MSPFSMVGIYPSTRCRSEPQIAVDVTLIIASRESKIFGSGTSSTRTSFVPNQQSAFILNLLVLTHRNLKRSLLAALMIGLQSSAHLDFHRFRSSGMN